MPTRPPGSSATTLPGGGQRHRSERRQPPDPRGDDHGRRYRGRQRLHQRRPLRRTDVGGSATALKTANGAITVAAAGPLAVVNVAAETDGSGKDVTLGASAGGVTITKLLAGTSTTTGSPSASHASVTAAGAIATSGTDTHIVAGSFP